MPRVLQHLGMGGGRPDGPEATHQLKPKGYSKLAYLFGKYPEAVLLRRFGHLNAMNLLRLQAKLMSLNRQFETNWIEDDASEDPDIVRFSTMFEEMEAADGRPEYRPEYRQENRRQNSRERRRGNGSDSRQGSIRNGSRDRSRDNRRARRLANLDAIRDTLKEYYEAMKLAADVAQLPRPENPRIRFLQSWLMGKYEGRKFLQEEEAKTYHDDFCDDLVALLPSTSWINPRVWDFLHWQIPQKEPDQAEPGQKEPVPTSWIKPRVSNFLHWLIPLKPTPKKMYDVELGRVEDVESTLAVRTSILLWQTVLVLFASMMSVIAVLILYYLKETVRRMGFAIGSTTFVGLFMFIFTAATEKEAFGMTAAYAAVVVVFIGSANGN